MTSWSLRSANVRRLLGGAATAVLLGLVGWWLGSIVAPSDRISLHANGRTHVLRAGDLQRLTVRNVMTGEQHTLAPNGRKRLYILLAASDCSSCLLETDQWNLLAHAGGDRLELIGLVVNSTLDEVREYAAGFTPTFPLYLAEGNAEMWEPLQGMTPVKILVDENHRPQLAEVGGSPSSTFGQRVLMAMGQDGR